MGYACRAVARCEGGSANPSARAASCKNRTCPRRCRHPSPLKLSSPRTARKRALLQSSARFSFTDADGASGTSLKRQEIDDRIPLYPGCDVNRMDEKDKNWLRKHLEQAFHTAVMAALNEHKAAARAASVRTKFPGEKHGRSLI